MDKPTHALIIATCVAVIIGTVIVVGPKVNADCVDLPFFHKCSVSTTK